LIPWQGGKPLTWDVTVVSTLAASYLSSSARSAGAAADLAELQQYNLGMGKVGKGWNGCGKWVEPADLPTPHAILA